MYINNSLLLYIEVITIRFQEIIEDLSNAISKCVLYKDDVKIVSIASKDDKLFITCTLYKSLMLGLLGVITLVHLKVNMLPKLSNAN